MGRFKAGDRVKILAGHPYVGVGTEGVYVDRANRGYRGKHNVRVTYEDGNTSELAFKGRELELIDAPAAQERRGLAVGDRVRLVESYGRSRAGDEGVISAFWAADGDDKGGIQLEMDNGSTPSCFAYRVELIAEAPATEWVPKVGDRVRYEDENTIGEGEIVAPSPEACFDWSVRTDGDQGFFYKDERFDFLTRHFATKHLSHLPDVEQPAGLVIEVGKFYCTRDGRKVGPIQPNLNGLSGFPWEDSNDIFTCWRDDGSFALKAGEEHRHDLVAEWVDEPEDLEAVEAEVKACLPATPEPAAPPAKFKVGDRVTPKADKLRKVVGHWERYWQRTEGRAHADVFYVVSEEVSLIGLRISAKPNGDGPYWPAAFFALFDAPAPVGAADPSFIVARLTLRGEPRPNARPRVHDTLEQANQEAQRLADRLGDEFAVYQRVSVRDVDAGPVPRRDTWPFDIQKARKWLAGETIGVGSAFPWDGTKQGWTFWEAQATSGLTPLGRAILRKWIAEVEAKQPVAA